MIEHESKPSDTAATPSPSDNATSELTSPRVAKEQQSKDRRENRRWWLKLLIQPLLFLLCGALLLASLGVAQRYGLISSSGHDGKTSGSAPAADTRYICPMMCTPPQTEPGRCPVCAMELVPAASDAGSSDIQSVDIGSAARRVANIRTSPVMSMPISRSIQAIGELSYDEGTLKTISAYVDGRLERLYADYTGVVVEKGDHLALVYSPLLYSAQVELLLAKKAQENGRSSTLNRVTQSSQQMYRSAKQRLIELGMTQTQIEELEQAGEANSRLHLCAPISGTVIEKFTVEGEYVKEGQAIYRLADLTTVWLMLELFPEDAASIRYGQKVEAEIQSLPGQTFSGRVAFIDPNVDPKTRTVGVRVVIKNQEGQLRVGDYAKATINVQLDHRHDRLVFDPELAHKWISPRHPHVVSDSPGSCPLCGVDLVAASQFGYSVDAGVESTSLVVPRGAVLMAGNSSVLYVETEPGRFEIRRVVLGPEVGDQIVIRSGVREGEHVATRGNFLIDSQMQLVGNPSLIDPNKAQERLDYGSSPELVAGLAELSVEDRQLAETQRICPVAGYRLGSMGTPIKVDVQGTSVFICCEGCRKRLLNEPDVYLAKLENMSRLENRDAKDESIVLPPVGSSRAAGSQMMLPPITAPQIIPESESGNVGNTGPAYPSADFPMEVVQ